MEQTKRLTQMKAALVDFLLRAHEIPHLERAILFGSLLEGDVNKKSDIDLLLIFDSESNPETGIELKEVTKLGLEVLGEYDIENNFSFVVVNIKTPSKTDKDFLETVAAEGVIVWEKGGFNFLLDHKAVRPKTIFDYSTQNISQANKRKLIRGVNKAAKLYGEKLGRGVLMVNRKHAEKVEKMLQKCQAKYTKQEVFS